MTTPRISIFYILVQYLDKDGDDIEAPDDGPVVRLPGQDVQPSHRPLHYLLHPHPVRVGAVSGPARGDRSSLLKTKK